MVERLSGFDMVQPEAVNAFFTELWNERAERIQRKIVVERCPYSAEELRELQFSQRRVAYLPKQLSSQQARQLLELIWPKMESFSTSEENTVTNEIDLYGWFDYEGSIISPYQETTEDQLRAIAEEQGRIGMTLNQYIIAGQDSKLLTGKYLDEGYTEDRQKMSLSRLFGSRRDGFVAHARFHPNGGLSVPSPRYSWNKMEGLGGRLVGLPGTS